MNISESKEMRVGLVVMASGESRRFGRNKLMEPLCGKPLIAWILDATEGLFDERVVVTRSKEVFELAKTRGIDCVSHALPYRSDTVRLGMEALSGLVDFCFFVPGDQPLLQRESLLRFVAKAKQRPDCILRAEYNGVVGSPIGFPSRYFPQLSALPEGKGGNFVARAHPEAVYPVLVEKEYELWDIDTQEDYEKIRTIV